MDDCFWNNEEITKATGDAAPWGHSLISLSYLRSPFYLHTLLPQCTGTFSFDQMFCFSVTLQRYVGTRATCQSSPPSYLHRLASLDKKHGNGPKEATWMGATGQSKESWESWKMTAVSGYAGGQGLYPRLKPAYATRLIPTDNSTDEVRRIYQEHKTEIQ